VALATEAEHARAPYGDEYRMVAADGGVVWLRERVQFLGGGERPVEVVGVMTDVTQEKHAEVLLRDSRERFELLARASHDAVGLGHRGRHGVAQPGLRRSSAAREATASR
jgi:PAS domain-containing protein